MTDTRVKSRSLPHGYKGLPSLWSRTIKLGGWQLSSHSPSNLASWNPKHLGFPGRKFYFLLRSLLSISYYRLRLSENKKTKKNKKTFTFPSFISLGFISYDYPRKRLKKHESFFILQLFRFLAAHQITY